MAVEEELEVRDRSRRNYFWILGSNCIYLKLLILSDVLDDVVLVKNLLILGSPLIVSRHSSYCERLETM